MSDDTAQDLEVHEDNAAADVAAVADAPQGTLMSLPVAISLALLILAQGSQSYIKYAELMQARELLQQRQQQLAPAVQRAQTLRAQLESIAGATATLAERGNENAVRIRDQLREQGINIKPAN